MAQTIARTGAAIIAGTPGAVNRSDSFTRAIPKSR
jgi:hypothetical protein